MRRRDILSAAAGIAGTGMSFPAPAIARGLKRLTMVTDWPEGPGVLPSARRMAKAIADASEGRIGIEVSSSGAVVRPFETFDAVQSGVADMFHSHIGYFEKKSPAFHFYSGHPFGFTANELFAWVHFGGGQELFDALSGQFNIKSLLCSSTGAQMGGWFVREIASIEDFKGMRYRMGGPGADVLRQLGAIVVLLPGAEIVQALRSGAIEACEWVGPWLDMAMGLHEAARFYYYPAWQEPGTGLTLGINKTVWDGLEEGERRLIEAAAAGEYALSLAEFNSNNAQALHTLRLDANVNIRRFEDGILKAFAEISRDVAAKAGGGDELSRKIYQSYTDFQRLIGDWSGTAEGSYLEFRQNLQL